MYPYIASGINGLGSIGSSAFSAIYGNYTQKKAYKYALALQKQQQAWQEYMSKTAHQREVNDLRLAGLNPILSATGGHGASFSNASGSPVSAPSASFDFDFGINSAAHVAQTVGNLELQETQKRVNGSVAELNRAETDAKKAQEDLFRAQAKQASATAKEISSGAPVNRIPGMGFNVIDSFLNSDLFQNAAARVFMNEKEFNKRRSEWYSRRNNFDHKLIVPRPKDEVKFHNGFKR